MFIVLTVMLKQIIILISMLIQMGRMSFSPLIQKVLKEMGILHCIFRIKRANGVFTIRGLLEMDWDQQGLQMQVLQ